MPEALQTGQPVRDEYGEKYVYIGGYELREFPVEEVDFTHPPTSSTLKLCTFIGDPPETIELQLISVADYVVFVSIIDNTTVVQGVATHDDIVENAHTRRNTDHYRVDWQDIEPHLTEPTNMFEDEEWNSLYT